MEPSEIGAETAGDAYLPQSGNGGYRTMSTSLSLRYRIARNRLDGVAELFLRANHRLARFSLDLVGLSVSHVRVDGRTADFRQAHGKVRITPERPVEPGVEFLVVIEYGGAPKPRRTRWGTIGWEELDDGVLVASQPSGAPTWFPCNDHPFDKASYRIRVETDAAYTVVAIGELEDQRVISGQGEWVYEQREPTASYLVTLQIGRYAQHSLAFDGVECDGALPPPLEHRVRADFEPLPRMLEVFEASFGPYPFARMRWS